jgi:serine phosphatase RsbU (regulator of sigma subunit)
MRLLLLLFIIIIVDFHLCAESIRNYSYHEYKGAPQVWDIVQDTNGFIFVATNFGISFFDGENWAKVNNSDFQIRNLHINDNTIYVGGQDQFGRICTRTNGQLYFESMLNKNLAEGYIWNITSSDKFVIFLTKKDYFLYNKSSNTTRKLALPNAKDKIKYLNGVFYLISNEHGFAKFDVSTGKILGQFNKFGGLDIDIAEIIQSTIPDEFILQGRNMLFKWKINGNLVENFHTPNERIEYIEGIQNGKGYTFCTKNKGIVNYNADGLIIDNINLDHGLPMNLGNTVMLDQKDNLWYGSNNGLSQIFSLDYLEETEYPFDIVKTIQWKDRLYFGTGVGLFELNPESPKTIEKINLIGLNTQCWDLMIFQNQLLVLSNIGVVSLQSNEKGQLIIEENVYGIHRSKMDSNRIYLGLNEGVKTLYYVNGSWIDEGYLVTEGKRVKYIWEDGLDLFLGCYDAPNYHCKMRYFGEELRLESIKDIGLLGEEEHNAIRPISFEGQILFGTKSGIWVYKKNDEYAYHDVNGLISNDSLFIHRLKVDPFGRLWVIALKINFQSAKIGCFQQENDTLIFNDYYFRPYIKELFHDIYFNDSLAYIGGNGRLLIYETTSSLIPNPFNTTIRSVNLNSDSTIFYGGTQNATPTINYEFNSLSFNVAAQDYKSKELFYSYYLEGFDEAWSEWDTDHKRTYTNLPEGEYALKVKAKNDYDIISSADTYLFRVLPPWYRTWWSYLIYGLFGVITIISTSKFYNNHLKLQIDKSTEIIKTKNKHIDYSISYAQNIQKAILPANSPSNSFLFFQPREKVSGDFAWFHSAKGLDYYCAADCTGHGIPGAFISILGTTLLNEIANQSKGELEPHNMLDKARKRMTTSLMGNGNSKSDDGMDLALISLNRKKGILKYSGANNPAYLISKHIYDIEKQTKLGDKFLYVLTPDYMTIGYNRKNESFSQMNMKVNAGDLVYLFSDGFLDQFGGLNGKKYGIKRFKELLLTISNNTLEEQYALITKEFDSWSQNYQQVDDVSVLGVKV